MIPRLTAIVLIAVWIPPLTAMERLPASNPAEGMNVVVIVADDLGWRDVGFQGSTFYQTPVLDRLASRGMRFTQGYSACQVCSPSRASLMTGRWPTHHGITDYIGAAWGENWKRNTLSLPARYQQQLAADETTLAERFQAAGYRTFFAGKWHLGGEGSMPTDHGFEINRGGNSTGTPAGGFFAPFENPQLADREPGESLTLRLGEETAEFIKQHSSEPFFAYLSFYAVHAPVQTTRQRWTKYRDIAASGPEVDARFLIDRTLPVRQVQDHPVYAGMIETMDEAIGMVVSAIEEQGLSDQTVIVFTSDNGGVSSGDAYATSNLPLRGGKGRQWEGGLRVPLLYVVPGVTDEASECDQVASGLDLVPTLAELCGLGTTQDQVDGVSLLPALKGESLPARDLFWHYPHYGNQGGEPSSIVQRERWKLIRYHEDGREELYDLKVDPSETTDLRESEPARASELSTRLTEWLERTGALMPVANPNFSAELAEREAVRIREQLLPQLEQSHAAFLAPNWQPNVHWWKSESQGSADR